MIEEMYLPQHALSIRQPWCWSIVHGGKRLENRDWRKPNPGLNFRGPICLHAGSGMTQSEYQSAKDFMASIGVTCPPPHQLQRGGIIGTAVIVDIIKSSDDPWFFGPRALVLEDVKSQPFIRVGGALGFFYWKEEARALYGQPPIDPAKWMKPAEETIKPETVIQTTEDLFSWEFAP